MFGFGKGTVSIDLPTYQFSPGQTITGTVRVTAKKMLHARATHIGIYALERTSSMRVRQGGVSTRSGAQYVVEFTQPIDGERELIPGQEYAFPFSLAVPQLPKLPDGALGAALQTMQMIAGGRRSVKWFLKAEVDVKGFDLTKKVDIQVTAPT